MLVFSLLFFSPPLLSSLQCLQIPFGFESGLTTASGCHYGLPVVRVGTVAGSKNTGNVGARRVCHSLDISGLVKFEIIFEHIGVGFVSDGKEEAIYRKVVTFLVRLTLTLHEMRPLDTVLAKVFIE